MGNNLDIFRKQFLGANSWVQRKDGVPLGLLDKLSIEELKTAEADLIKAAGINDDWPIRGLGHIQSTKALPLLYALLEKGRKGIKVAIAYAIYQICRDPRMIDQVLDELPEISDQNVLIEVFYLLPAFSDERLTAVLHSYLDDNEFLVAYNATRALGLSTDEVIKKFRAVGRK